MNLNQLNSDTFCIYSQKQKRADEDSRRQVCLLQCLLKWKICIHVYSLQV